jgi:hypothetical protein
MTNFVLATPSQKQVWSNKVTTEYVRESGFLPYLSSKGDGIINVQNELNGSAGNLIHIPLIAKLRGAGVRGSATLTGNEDVMANYSMKIQTDVLRNAVSIPYTEQFKTEMDLVGAATTDLRSWLAEMLRTDIITALRSVPTAGSGGTNPEDGSVAYETANSTQQNAWLVANADRVLYGARQANMTTGNHASSLAVISATNDKVTGKMISLARKKARSTTNSSTFAIKPYKTKDGQEWYVLFLDSNGFRDAKFDPAIYNANKDARPRESEINDNPLFSGDYLTFDGVIIKEIPELANPTGSSLLTAGATSSNVGYGMLCGVQAVNLGYSMKAKPVRGKEDDFEFLSKIGVMETRGQQKASVNLTQIGMLSMYYSSIDDA